MPTSHPKPATIVEMDKYEILGVSSDANIKTIRKSYQKLAMMLHPDKNLGNMEEAEAMMKLINEAYETLKDLEKRDEYDIEQRAAKKRDGGYSIPSYSRKKYY